MGHGNHEQHSAAAPAACPLGQVLSIYPTTIRRRILRHLYLRHLRASYLFRWVRSPSLAGTCSQHSRHHSRQHSSLLAEAA